MLPSLRWQWPSTKPGISTLAAKRSSSVNRPQACMSASVPTASTRPSRTATWLACGCIGVMVMILRAGGPGGAGGVGEGHMAGVRLHRVHGDDLAGRVDGSVVAGVHGVHGADGADGAVGIESGGCGRPSITATRRQRTQ